MTPPSKLTFLQAGVGRGHPFYLDGIIDRVRNRPNPPQVEELDAEGVSRGLSKTAWRAVRLLYLHGSSGGVIGAVYSGLRRGTDYEKGGLALNLLGRGIRRRLRSESSPLVVSHPMLVALLAGRPNLIYQHGELIAPEESRVRGASTVLVPTEEAAELFRDVGYSREQVRVTGLCIEPGAVAVASNSFQERLKRLRRQIPLTGLMVSSGAEPQQHIRTIISSITSCRRAGVRTLVLARMGGRLDGAVQWLARQERARFGASTGGQPDQSTSGECRLVSVRERSGECEALSFLLPAVDFFVGPPHERSNWAVGLGLPMFVVTPCIGPFAPLNLELLESSGTARVLRSVDDASRLGETVLAMKESGELARMAERGWGKYRIDGFEQIARILLDEA